MPSIRFRPEVAEDLRNAVDWYDAKKTAWVMSFSVSTGQRSTELWIDRWRMDWPTRDYELVAYSGFPT